jgi:hypothetical protein
MPVSFLLLANFSPVDSPEAGSALSGFTEELFEIRPDVRIMAPVSRDSTSVL